MKTLVVMAFFLTVSLFAASTDGSVSAQLCRWWKYDFDSSAYVCNILGPRVNLVTTKREGKSVEELEARIEKLEKRLSELEK